MSTLKRYDRRLAKWCLEPVGHDPNEDPVHCLAQWDTALDEHMSMLCCGMLVMDANVIGIVVGFDMTDEDSQVPAKIPRAVYVLLNGTVP